MNCPECGTAAIADETFCRDCGTILDHADEPPPAPEIELILEISAGPGAGRTFPLNEINQHLAEIPKEKPFLLHCAGGYRSMIASSILKQRGWSNFADIVGGFDEMKETSLPKSDYICPTTML